MCAQRKEGVMKDLIIYVAERLVFFPFILIFLYIIWDTIQRIIELNQEEEDDE